MPTVFGALGSSTAIAMSSKREVAASSLCRYIVSGTDLGPLERQHQNAKAEHPYRLMRVVKLCIWPPLAMVGNTLRKEAQGVG